MSGFADILLVWLLLQAHLLYFTLIPVPVFCAVNCSCLLSATETIQLSKRRMEWKTEWTGKRTNYDYLYTFFRITV